MQTNYLTYRDAVFASTADTLEYVIKRGDDCIFRGVAIKAPGADYAYIPVGEICRGYLENNLPSDFDQLNDYIMKQLNAWASFVLYSVDRTIIWNGPDTHIDDITEQAEGIYNFLLNWEYIGPTWDGERRVLSDPINGRIDPRMRFVYTEFNLVTCNCFCVTPLLSAPSSGATLQAKIVVSDEFDDPSKLELIVDSELVDADNISLSGVTFIVSPNTGYNQEIKIEYWYDGEYKATTTIISAGDLGENPNGGSGSGSGEGIYGRRSSWQYGIPGTAMYSGYTSWPEAGGRNTGGLANIMPLVTLPGVYEAEFRAEAPNAYLEVASTGPLTAIVRLKEGVEYAPLGETFVVRVYQKTGVNVKRLIGRATFIVTSLYRREYPGWEDAVTGVRYVNVTDISAYTIVDSISVNYTGSSVEDITAVSDGGTSFTIAFNSHINTTAIVITQYDDGYGHHPHFQATQQTEWHNNPLDPFDESTIQVCVSPFRVWAVEYCYLENTSTGYTLHSSVWLYEQYCSKSNNTVDFTTTFSEYAESIENHLGTTMKFGGTISDLSERLTYNYYNDPCTVICSDGTTTLVPNLPGDIIIQQPLL